MTKGRGPKRERDVREVRARTGLSQAEFAERFGFSLRTLQEWEQGRAKPDSAVRAYLTVIDREPESVMKALGVTSPAGAYPAARAGDS